MYTNPEEWRFPFVYGFINYAFLADYGVARTYFRVASMKPGAPDIAQRWAAFVTYYKLGDLKTALALWVDLYNNTENPEEKTLATYYIGKIKMKIDIEYLDEKAIEFQNTLGRLPYDLDELTEHGFVSEVPDEPHGEEYYMRDGKVHSTWTDKIPPHMRR
jgi:hypothetical protein